MPWKLLSVRFVRAWIRPSAVLVHASGMTSHVDKHGGTGFGSPQYGTDNFGTANQVRWKEPYSLQWSLSVERNLGFETGLRVSYIGMKTAQLLWAPNWNQSLPSTIPYQLQPLSSRPFPNWQS